MTLNDTTFVECSVALADRMARSDEDVTAQIRYGFIAVTSREPNAEEARALTELHQSCLQDGASPLEAMTAIASVLLNLDEITSK